MPAEPIVRDSAPAAAQPATAAITPAPARPSWRELAPSDRRRVAGYGAYAAVVTLVFGPSLAALFAYASGTSLHSHIPLVPVITAYLLFVQATRSRDHYGTSMVGTAILGLVGGAALVVAMSGPPGLSENDHLGLVTLGYVSFIAAGGFLFLGSKWMAAAAFPVSFLIFMIPLPDAAAYWLERGLVVASAHAAAFLFGLTGTPFWREGTYIGLPGIVLHVAQECSGIRSSWVLFITSLLASHLLLTTGWRRAALVALVLPLGVIRNAIRIVVIGLLCVNVGPHMIDSEIHRRGGPLFFAASLVPLFLAAIWLRRQERRHGATQAS